MKLLLLAALLAAAGVSAATSTASAAAPSPTSDCAADYIVTTCLEGETAKAKACEPTDYKCFCAAYQAVETCYNNCPNDVRAAPAKNQADAYCRTASLLATTAPVTTTASSSSKSSASPSSADGQASGSVTKPATAATSTSTASSNGSRNTAASLAGNAGSAVLAIAGVVAAMMQYAC